MDSQDRDAIELEVRRVLATQEIELRKLWSAEAAGFREFLQRQFRYITFGVSAFALVGAGLFVWFFSDSVERTQKQLEATVDAKVIEYRIVESLKNRVSQFVEIAASNEKTRQKIHEEIKNIATIIVDDIAEDKIREKVGLELKKVEGLNVESLIQQYAEIERGAIVAFANRMGCPDGWTRFEAANGRFMLGVSDSFGPLATGGERSVTLTEAELPAHDHLIGQFEWGHSINGNGHAPRIDVDDGPPWGERTGLLLADASGENQSHNNMPPYIALYFCKKT